MPELPVHTETLTVKSYEVDFRGRWKPHCLQWALQEAASNHAAALGYGYPEMRERGLAWVLSRMRIDFHAMPAMRDIVTLRTWPKGVQQRLFFTRDFTLTSGDRPIAEATSAWVVVDWARRRVLPPAALPGGLPMNPNDAIPDLLEKIPVPEGLALLGSFRAGYTAMDPVGHANSARYFEWILDCFPTESYHERSLSRIQVNFSGEVKAEETVEIRAGEVEGRWLAQGSLVESGARSFEAWLEWGNRI